MRLLCLCLMIICIHAKAQNTFACKVQVLHNKLGVQKNIKLLVDNQYNVVTDDAGVFVIPLRNEVSHIRVTLPSSSYKILYPVGGYIAIPKSPDDVPQLIIGNADENIYLSQYINLYQLIKNSGSASAASVQLLNAKMDSLQALLLQLHYTQSDLNLAKQIQDEKDVYYPEITADLLEYQNRIHNVASALKYVSDYAFEKATALQQLLNAVTNYNTIYDKLNRQHLNYENRVQELWGDTLSNQLKILNRFILDSVHAANLDAMRQSNNQLNDYFINKRNDKNLKSHIQQQIAALVASLDAVLPKLDVMINRFQSLLTE